MSKIIIELKGDSTNLKSSMHSSILGKTLQFRVAFNDKNS